MGCLPELSIISIVLFGAILINLIFFIGVSLQVFRLVFQSLLRTNSKQGKLKKAVPLPVTLHLHHDARRDLEGWSYTDSKFKALSWPVLCPNPDCREARCKETRNDCYHWELDWKSESATRDYWKPYMYTNCSHERRDGMKWSVTSRLDEWKSITSMLDEWKSITSWLHEARSSSCNLFSEKLCWRFGNKICFLSWWYQYPP